MDLEGVQALLLDPRRFGTPAERAAYVDALTERYAEVASTLTALTGLPDWGRHTQAWVDDQLALVTAVVHQVGTLRGAYDDARVWGDRALELGRRGSRVRRADLMLHVSELYRVTGRPDRAAELVHRAVGLLELDRLTADDVDALAPVTCHALFCLGALAVWEERPDDAEPYLAHAWSHGGDSVPHLWSLVNYALVEAGRGRHDAALALEDAACAMAERLGEELALLAARNNRACTLRRLGRHAEAFEEFAATLPALLGQDVPDALLTATEDFACVLFDLGRDEHGALLVGAAAAERAALGVPRMAIQEAEVASSLRAGRDRLGARWPPLLARGAELGVLAAAATALRRS